MTSDPLEAPLRTVIVVLMVLAPFFFVVVQQRGVRRQQALLDALPACLQATALWRAARDVLSRRYFLPIRRSGRRTVAAGG